MYLSYKIQIFKNGNFNFDFRHPKGLSVNYKYPRSFKIMIDVSIAKIRLIDILVSEI